MGLFKNNKRVSTGSSSPIPQSSELSNHDIRSQNNSIPSLSRGPPPRRAPLPRSITTDHMVPPPIQQGEIEAFASQVDDLSRCTDNAGLFELLVSDIDRNRLTQLTMILAEKGDYPAMARVMEISDKVDSLIRNQVDESHRRQRRSLRGTVDNDPTLDDFLREADELNANSSLTVAELRAKVQMFDQCFSDFQNESFEQLVVLSEKVEIMRKRLQRMNVEPVPSHTETWETFPVLQVSKEDELVHDVVDQTEALVPVLQENVVHVPGSEVDHDVPVGQEMVVEMSEESEVLKNVDEGTQAMPPQVDAPPEEWETFNMVHSPRMVVSRMTIDEAASTADAKLAMIVFTFWKTVKLKKRLHVCLNIHIRAIQRDAFKPWLNLVNNIQVARERIVHDQLKFKDRRVMRLVMATWMISSSNHAYSEALSRFQQRQTFSLWRSLTYSKLKNSDLLSNLLRAWCQHVCSRKEIINRVVTEDKIQTLGPILSAWVSETTATRNLIFSIQTSQRERAEADCFRAWHALTGAPRSGACSEDIGANTDKDREETTEWAGQSLMQRRTEKSLRRVLKEWHNECLHNQSLSPLRGLGILAGEHKDAPTSPEAWLEELPDGVEYTADDSQASIPESVEHYIIHDSPVVHSATDIRLRTEEIIAKTQIFLSQRHLRSFSPPPFMEANHFTPMKSGQQEHSSYFSWFDNKWAKEEKRWQL